MEDPSVDVSSLDRIEILAKLDPKPDSSIGKERLRTVLKKSLQKNHPIHDYLCQLIQETLKELYMIIFEKPCNRHYNQVRKSLAHKMFLNFPKAPLATLLIWIKRCKRIPTKIEFGFLL